MIHAHALTPVTLFFFQHFIVFPLYQITRFPEFAIKELNTRRAKTWPFPVIIPSCFDSTIQDQHRHAYLSLIWYSSCQNITIFQLSFAICFLIIMVIQRT